MTTLYARFLICGDGTILESRNSHDFKSHKSVDGSYYFIDGGCSEVYRRSTLGKVLEITSDNCHFITREWFSWGRNFDKFGERLDSTQYIKLKEISDDHLNAILEFQKTYKGRFYDLFKKELAYRQEHGIVVPDYD